MPRILGFLLLLVGVLLPHAADAADDAKKASEPPVTSLFDGKGLDGWAEPLDNSAEWQVNGGILEGRGGGIGQPAVLVTERQDYGDYKLRILFGFTGQAGGGGVELRRSGEDAVTTCYFVTANAGPYSEVKERPSGNITRLRSYTYGSKLTVPPRPSARVALGANTWHTLDVTVAGNRVTTFIDGKKVDDYTDRKKDAASSGGIALFCRGDSCLKVKSIHIQEFGDAAAE